MPNCQSVLAPDSNSRRWRLLAVLLVLAVAGLRLLYLARLCPLDLAPDEAHYWDWSRHLDWSYYSKGPLVAYLIRLGCLLAGPWSEQLIANQMLAVRLPAIVCGALLLFSMYILTVQVYGSDRLAFAVVALALTLPMVAAGSLLMTIDAPYTCFWGWALVAGHRAIFRGSTWAWPVTGLLIGLGILAKYTMILWLPAAGCFLLTTPAHRRLLFRPGFWIMTGVAAACCVPILVWNMQHDWVSWRHVGGQAGMIDTPGLRWLGPLSYLGEQFGMLLGFWFVAWAGAMLAHRPWRESDAGIRYLWWMSALMFGVFFVFSIKSDEEPNWPVTAYLSGMVLTVAHVARELRAAAGRRRRLIVGSLTAACVLGLALCTVMHESALLRRPLLWLSGPPTAENPLPVRRFDPTCRLRGWPTLAAKVDDRRAQLSREGIDPVIVGESWTLPGELAFYCAGHPTVYTIGSAAGDRQSQYDLWHPNPVADGQQFEGRTMIYVGNVNWIVRAAFDTVEEPCDVVYSEDGVPIARWTVTICRGFRGLPRVLQAPFHY